MVCQMRGKDLFGSHALFQNGKFFFLKWESHFIMKFRCIKKVFLLDNKKESKFCLKNYKMRINDVVNSTSEEEFKKILKGFQK